MAGIIDKAGLPNDAGVSEEQFLNECVDQLERNVPAQVKENFDRIVVAATQILWSDKTHSLVKSYLAKIDTEEEIPAFVAKGVVWVIQTVIRESKLEGAKKGELLPAIGIAAQVITIHALIYLEKLKSELTIDREVTAKTVERATKAVMVSIGITDSVMKRLQKLGDEAKGRYKKGERYNPDATAQGPTPAEPGAPVPAEGAAPEAAPAAPEAPAPGAPAPGAPAPAQPQPIVGGM